MQRTILTLSLLSGIIFASAAYAANVSNKGAAVVDQRGGCIHTKWSDDEGCAGLVPDKVAAPVTQDDEVKASGEKSADLSQEARSVYFDFGKATLNTEARSKLDDVVNFIKSNNVKNMEIVGYTDAVGSSAYNDSLSKRRADAVRNYLSGRTKTASSTTVRGLGASSQSECGDNLSRNARIECMAKDRRVEIELRYE